MPIAAAIHIVEAVVKPIAFCSVRKITPAPKKPMPVIIFAAIRSVSFPPILKDKIVNNTNVIIATNKKLSFIIFLSNINKKRHY